MVNMYSKETIDYRFRFHGNALNSANFRYYTIYAKSIVFEDKATQTYVVIHIC